jgi:putative transcriptional regulator
MLRERLLSNAREVLTSTGFYVSELYPAYATVFDMVARRDDSLIIVKVLTNVDSLSEEVAKEIKTLCSLLEASPLLIGEKNGSGVLEDNVIYYRFGIPAVTLTTLKHYLFEGTPIKAYAAPGGLYVNLDEEKLRRLRQEKNISLGTFARYVNVSRRMVRMYEEGMNSRIEVAHRIEELLESPITVPLDLLKNPMQSKISLTYPKIRNDFHREIFSLLQRVGYKIIPMGKCPFEALSKIKEKILLTCVHKYDNKLAKRAQIVHGISKVTEKQAVVFIDRDVDKRNVEGTPIIPKRELKKVRDPEEVFDLIKERI